jgi:imidazolonepropionase-like amidohydrolase
MAPNGLYGGRIYTAVGDEAPRDGVLVMDGARIADVYPSRSAAEDALGEIRWIDVTGSTVMPGLIDCHVHLFLTGSADLASLVDEDADRAYERALVHLRAGVTTVRDLGGFTPQIYALRDAIAVSRLGPRIISAGRMLTTVGGHAAFLGREVPTGTLGEAIDATAAEGADWIKIMASGGMATPGSDPSHVQFSLAEISATVTRAHELGRPVAAHASNAASVSACAVAGVDSIEHAMDLDDAGLEALASSRSFVVPTLAVTSRDTGSQRVAATHRASIERLVAAGVPLAAGTDAGAIATPHGVIADEAALLAATGLSATDALAALTRNAAAVLGLSDELGTLEPGKVADIVVVDGDPVADLASLRHVCHVFSRGMVVDLS